MRVTTRQMPPNDSPQRQTVLGLFPLLFGIQIVAALVFVPIALNGNADFRQYFAGGLMVRTGLRHQLYDISKQSEVEDTIAPWHSPQVLPVNHPAYEYLLFAPLTVSRISIGLSVMARSKSRYWRNLLQVAPPTL